MAIIRSFRQEYVGEFLIHSRTLKNGIYEENREWIPNTVKIDIDSDSAVVFGNGMSRAQHFEFKWIARHKGGHLNKHKLYSYGCNAFYRDYAPDFLVADNGNMIDEIVDSGYANDNIVYSTSTQIARYPGNFHLIPYSVRVNTGAMATYLAAFDGFKKIYLVGFDTQDASGLNNNVYAGTDNYQGRHTTISDEKWTQCMYNIMKAYHDVQFYRVMPGANPVTAIHWKGCLNYQNITYRQFISYADL